MTKKKIILGILVVLGMFFGMGTLTMAEATTYYVDAVNGDDSNLGTPAEPFKTIGKGIAVAIDGDTVQCAPGTYTERVSINKRIALVGKDPKTTIIDPVEDGIAVGMPVDGATITCFTVTGASGDVWPESRGICCDGSSPNIINNIITENPNVNIWCTNNASPNIINNIISKSLSNIQCDHNSSPNIMGNIIKEGGAYAGISIFSNASPTIINNIISENNLGIWCDDGTSPNIINNIIRDNRDSGISCIGGSPNITNNTIINNERNGVFCQYVSSSPNITNNIISGNPKGIWCYDGPTPHIDYNDVYPKIYEGCNPGDHDIWEPPQFVDEATGDYHLKPTSPCIDREGRTYSNPASEVGLERLCNNYTSHP